MGIKKYLVFSGTMTLESGLHIGGSTDETKVGGCDNPIIKNKMTDEPYIPGSSIKGIMRSIEESRPKYAAKIQNGMPCGCGSEDCMVCRLFGAHKNTRTRAGLPRLIAHNMTINKDFKDQLIRSGGTTTDMVDIKYSTMINRQTKTAANGSLRNIEIVSAGTVFDCKFTLKILENDNEEELIKELRFIIDRIEIEGIGSKTTSGNGQVKFDIDFEDPKEYKM